MWTSCSGAAAELGAPLIAAEFPRVYNRRQPRRLGTRGQMFDPAQAGEAASGARSGGIGVIPAHRARRAESIAANSAAGRKHGFTPSVRPLSRSAGKAGRRDLRAFRAAVVVDCHSMPSGPSVPSIVFGDCHGTSAASRWLRQAETAFEEAGFSIARTRLCRRLHHDHYARRRDGHHASRSK